MVTPGGLPVGGTGGGAGGALVWADAPLEELEADCGVLLTTMVDIDLLEKFGQRFSPFLDGWG